MATFFDRDFLQGYLATKLKDIAGGFDVQAQVATMVASDDFGKLVEEKLEALRELPMMAAMIAAGMQPASLKPMVIPFVANLGKDLAPLLLEKLTDAAIMIDINDVRGEIEMYASPFSCSHPFQSHLSVCPCSMSSMPLAMVLRRRLLPPHCHRVLEALSRGD